MGPIPAARRAPGSPTRCERQPARPLRGGHGAGRVGPRGARGPRLGVDGPERVHRPRRPERAGDPTACRFAPDGACSWPRRAARSRSSPSLTEHDVDNRAPTSAAGRRLLGPRAARAGARPRSSPAAGPTSTCSTPTTPRSAAPRRSWNDGCPTPPGPTTDGCIVSGASRSSRQRQHRHHEQVLVNDWCQQFPSHSIGTLHVRARRHTSTSRRRRRELQQRRLRAVRRQLRRRPGQPVRRPAGRGRHRADAHRPPRAARCAARASGAPTARPTLDGAVIRIDPATGPGCAGQPVLLLADANARRIVAYGLRNPFRFTQRPAPTSSGSATSAGTPGRRSTASSRPTARRRRTSAGRATRERPPKAATRAPASTCARRSTRAGLGRSRRTTPTTTARASSNYTGCRTGGSSITGIAFYTGRLLPGAVQRRAVLRRPPRNEIWAMLPGTNGLPDPTQIQRRRRRRHRRRRRASGRPRGGPGRRHVLRRHGRRTDPPHHLHGRQPAADRRDDGEPDERPAPLTVSFDGTGSTDPEGHALSYSWDLDGDGTFGDATGPTAVLHLHDDGHVYHPSSRVTDDQRRDGHDLGDRHGWATPRRSPSSTRRRGPDVEGRRRDQRSPATPPTRRTGRCRRSVPELGLRHPPLLHGLAPTATRTRSRRHRGRQRNVHALPTTATRASSRSGSPRPTPAGWPRPRASAWTRRPSC